MRRVFIAVDISDEARRKTAAYVERLRGAFREVRTGWEKPEKLHFTLKFLGDTDDDQLAELKQIIGETAAKVEDFTLKIADTGVFPNARSPRVLWLDVKDERGSLAEINQSLETECAKIGFAREQRKFMPHLTIGRVREPNRARALAEKHLANEFEPVEFAVSEIVIYESELLPTGSVYKVVEKQKLS